MTSKLKCPFCGWKLGRKNINDRMCSNEKCVSWKGSFYGSEDLWQTLIQTKQDLEILKEALRIVRNQYLFVKPKGFSPRGDMATLCAMGEVAEKALKQIEQKDEK